MINSSPHIKESVFPPVYCTRHIESLRIQDIYSMLDNTENPNSEEG